MSSISNVSASSTSDAAAIYREYLARMQAQKQSAQKAQPNEQSLPAVPAAGDVDHDGDSH